MEHPLYSNSTPILVLNQIIIFNYSRFMRTECLNHRYAHDAPMPVGRLIGLVGNKMQICTQRYDKRPLGVGLLVAGYDVSVNFVFDLALNIPLLGVGLFLYTGQGLELDPHSALLRVGGYTPYYE